MMTSEKIMKKIQENKLEIKEFGVKRLGLFGSFVKDEQKTGSDVDLAVEFDTGKKTFDNFMDLKFFLENLLENKVDLIIIEAIKPELKRRILEEVQYA